MNCPKCNHNKTTVLDTRNDKENIYRKRRCKKCNNVWFTTESVDGDGRYKLQQAVYNTYGSRKRNSKKLFDILPKLSDNFKFFVICRRISETEGITKTVHHIYSNEELYNLINDFIAKADSVRVDISYETNIPHNIWRSLESNSFTINSQTLNSIVDWLKSVM